MMGSRQKLAVEGALPSSTMGSPCRRDSTDIRSACQRQVEQLAEQLPIVAAWIVYQDQNQGTRQSFVHYRQKPSCSYPDLSYLDSEVWLVDSLPALKLSEVAREGSLTAFVCPLGQYSSNPEYLLLWTYEPLSALQQEWAEQQAQFLFNYITVYRECCRQQAEIQLLEQVVQRTEHQLRNPLALIALYAENLCLGLPAGSMQEQAMNIRETVNELSTSLTDLLYCGQQVKLRVAPHDLRTLLAESIKGVQPWIEEKKLHIRYPDKPVTLAVDRSQLKHVFDNLLSNAVYFSPQGATVTCHWQVFRHEVLVEVSDQGPGLSEEDLKQVFTPFYTRRLGGTGLGLAIAKKIILDHQGSLWVQNLPEGGAQFSFSLPRLRT
jgi:signal transduction histidine kinase